MFRGCARPERDVFVTRKEGDVGEQGVLGKEKGVGEGKGCWAISGPNLGQI